MHSFPAAMACTTRLDIVLRTDMITLVERGVRTAGVLPNLRDVSLRFVAEESGWPSAARCAAQLMQTLALCTSKEPHLHIGHEGFALWKEFSIGYTEDAEVETVGPAIWADNLRCMTSLTRLSISTDSFPRLTTDGSPYHLILPSTLHHISVCIDMAMNLFDAIGPNALLPNLRFVDITNVDGWLHGKSLLTIADRHIVTDPDLHIRVERTLDYNTLSWLLSILHPTVLEVATIENWHSAEWASGVYSIMKERHIGESIVELRTTSEDSAAWALGASMEILTSLKRIVFISGKMGRRVEAARVGHPIEMKPCEYIFVRPDKTTITMELWECENPFTTLTKMAENAPTGSDWKMPVDAWPFLPSDPNCCGE